MRASGLCPDPSALNFNFAKKIFRTDIFEQASELSRQGREIRTANSEKENSFAPVAALA